MGHHAVDTRYLPTVTPGRFTCMVSQRGFSEAIALPPCVSLQLVSAAYPNPPNPLDFPSPEGSEPGFLLHTPTWGRYLSTDLSVARALHHAWI